MPEAGPRLEKCSALLPCGEAGGAEMIRLQCFPLSLNKPFPIPQFFYYEPEDLVIGFAFKSFHHSGK